MLKPSTLAQINSTPALNKPRARQVQTGQEAIALSERGENVTGRERTLGFSIEMNLGARRTQVLAFDFDKNGSISKDELSQSLRLLNSFSKPEDEGQDSGELAAMRRTLDPNGDGVLNSQELRNSNARLINPLSLRSREAVSEGFTSSFADSFTKDVPGRDVLLDLDLNNGTANVARVDVARVSVSNSSNGPFIQETSVSKVARIFPLLGRQPTQGDYDFWSEQLDSGRATETTMLASFLEASGRDNRGTVDQLYRTVLGQEPNTSAAGADAWVSALDGGLPLVTIVQGFLNIRNQQRSQG